MVQTVTRDFTTTAYRIVEVAGDLTCALYAGGFTRATFSRRAKSSLAHSWPLYARNESRSAPDQVPLRLSPRFFAPTDSLPHTPRKSTASPD